MDKQTIFYQFIDQNCNSAYRFAYSYTKNQQDAEDVVNESVIKAMRGLGGLRDVSKMKPWFFKIISNTAISWIQKQKKTTTSTLEDMEPLLSAQDDYSQMMVEDMLSALDEKYKSVLVLRYFERMTIAEIGEVLDMNENTVKTRLYRALEQLRIQMEVDVS